MYRDKILGKDELEVFNYLKDKFMPDAVIAGGAVRDLIMEKPFKDIDIWFNHTKVGVPQRFLELSLPKELGFKCGEDYVDIPLNFTGERMRAEPDDEAGEVPEGVPRVRPGLTTTREITNAALGIIQRQAVPRAEAFRGALAVGRAPATRRLTFDDVAIPPDLFGSMPPTMAKARHKVLYSFSMYYKGVQYQIMNLGMSPKTFVKEAFDIGFCKAMHDGKKIIRLPEFDTDLKNKTLTLDGKALGAANFKWAMEKHIPRLLKLYPDFKVNVTSHPPVEKKRSPHIDYEQEMNRLTAARVNAMGMTQAAQFATTSTLTWNVTATAPTEWVGVFDDAPAPHPEPQPQTWPVVAEDEFGTLDEELQRRPVTTHPSQWNSLIEMAGNLTPNTEPEALAQLDRMRAGMERAEFEGNIEARDRYMNRIRRLERMLMGVTR